MSIPRMQYIAVIGCLALAWALAVPGASSTSKAEEPPVGWCAYYPIHPAGADVIGKTGASMLSVIGSGWGIWSNEESIDFRPMDAQIELARKNGLKLGLISETNPVYSQAWMNARTKAAGQNALGCGGGDAGIPTLSSPVFREGQDKLIRGVVDHVKQVDKDGTIRWYHPGCEWWFPYGTRYNELEVNHFREWLKAKYKTIDKLNRRWVSVYKAFSDVPAPRVDLIQSSQTELGRLISPDLGQEHCSWSIGGSTGENTPKEMLAIVEPGASYDLSCWIKTENLQSPGAFIEVAWISPNGGPPISGSVSDHMSGSNDWTFVKFAAKVPTNAGRAWILLKAAGTGRAWFDDVSICRQGSDVNLAPNPGFEGGSDLPDAWSFQNWTGGTNVISEYQQSGGRNGSRCLEVDIKPIDASYKNADAAMYDWTTFWYEFGADYINGLAGIYKKYDSQRQTVSWLTMSFAYPAEWDYSQQMSIAPDEVAARGKNLDVIGMQICSADGDPYRPTADIDIVRKYNKPVWAMDLIDFTSGVHIGYSKMNKVTQSVIQHGADGIVYCLWYLPGAESYSFYQHWSLADMNRMLGGAKSSIRLLKGYRIKPDAAIVLPIMPASSVDKDGFKNDYRSFMGWYKILEKMQLTFDVVTLKEIEKGAADLGRYKLVVVPDCAYLTDGALSRLTAYSKMGGTLLSGGRFAMYNEAANPFPNEQAPACKRISLPDYGKDYTGVLIRDTHSDTNTPPLFLWGDDTVERQKTFTAVRNSLSGIIAKSKIKSVTEIYPRNDSIRSVIRENGNRKAIHLVNMGDSAIAGQILRVQGVTNSNAAVYADNVRKTVKCRKAKSGSGAPCIEMELPRFETSCIVFVE